MRGLDAVPGLIPAHAGKTTRSRRCPRLPPAHPRSRGENESASLGAVEEEGSSPLTRGKRRAHGHRHPPRRLIPAHAGKTPCPPRRSLWARAHPRSRGENAVLGMMSMHENGSSPLTRGKPFLAGHRFPVTGLIPAHAGKTKEGKVAVLALGAHPRSRGENSYTASPEQDPKGSSPLTRGKLSGWMPRPRPRRLIPAHAGKTSSRSSTSTPPAAHPRSRGENTGEIEDAVREAGSSPLTRGKRGASRAEDDFDGLIPAHAGKTSGLGGGDKVGSGSSPLTRGKPRIALRSRRSRRLIPAHAGKTMIFCSGSTRTRAHPRSRGENRRTRERVRGRHGSSPLTRGKQDHSSFLILVAGLIPAHAGKTCAPGSKNQPPGAHPRSRGENTT